MPALLSEFNSVKSYYIALCNTVDRRGRVRNLSRLFNYC